MLPQSSPNGFGSVTRPLAIARKRSERLAASAFLASQCSDDAPKVSLPSDDADGLVGSAETRAAQAHSRNDTSHRLVGSAAAGRATETAASLREEACEGRQRSMVVRFGGKRRMEGREDGLESGPSPEQGVAWPSSRCMKHVLYSRQPASPQTRLVCPSL